MTDALGLLGFIMACMVAGASGAVWGPGTWYERLRKPSWRPPNWLFPPAWAVLYMMIAVSAWMIWRTRGYGPELVPWFVQLGFNFLWSFFFFGLRRPDLAFADLACLWLSIAWTILAFAAVSEVAAWLLVPYLGWVTFAGALNLALWRMNGSRPA